MSCSILIYPAPPVRGLQLYGENLKCLEEGQDLNDAVVNIYLKIVYYEILSNDQRKKSEILDTFFYMEIIQNKKPRTATKNYLEKEFIIMPINSKYVN